MQVLCTTACVYYYAAGSLFPGSVLCFFVNNVGLQQLQRSSRRSVCGGLDYPSITTAVASPSSSFFEQILGPSG